MELFVPTNPYERFMVQSVAYQMNKGLSNGIRAVDAREEMLESIVELKKMIEESTKKMSLLTESMRERTKEREEKMAEIIASWKKSRLSNMGKREEDDQDSSFTQQPSSPPPSLLLLPPSPPLLPPPPPPLSPPLLPLPLPCIFCQEGLCFRRHLHSSQDTPPSDVEEVSSEVPEAESEPKVTSQPPASSPSEIEVKSGEKIDLWKYPTLKERFHSTIPENVSHGNNNSPTPPPLPPPPSPPLSPPSLGLEKRNEVAIPIIASQIQGVRRLDRAIIVAGGYLEGIDLVWYECGRRKRPIRDWEELKGLIHRQEFRSPNVGAERCLPFYLVGMKTENQRIVLAMTAPLKVGHQRNGLKIANWAELKLLSQHNIGPTMGSTMMDEEKISPNTIKSPVTKETQWCVVNSIYLTTASPLPIGTPLAIFFSNLATIVLTTASISFKLVPKTLDFNEGISSYRNSTHPRPLFVCQFTSQKRVHLLLALPTTKDIRSEINCVQRIGKSYNIYGGFYSNIELLECGEHPIPAVEVTTGISLYQSSDGNPLLKELKYFPKYDEALSQVFATTRVAYGWNCFTREGDQSMSSQIFDKRCSKLESEKTTRHTTMSITAKKDKLQTVKSELDILDNEINAIVAEQQKGVKTCHEKSVVEQLKQEVSNDNKRAQKIFQFFENKMSRANVKAQTEQVRNNTAMKKDEMGTYHKDHLNLHGKNLLSQLNFERVELRKKSITSQEIQASHADIEDKATLIIGSCEWIGAIKFNFVLDKLLGISYKVDLWAGGIVKSPEKCKNVVVVKESRKVPSSNVHYLAPRVITEKKWKADEVVKMIMKEGHVTKEGLKLKETEGEQRKHQSLEENFEGVSVYFIKQLVLDLQCWLLVVYHSLNMSATGTDPFLHLEDKVKV